MMIFILNAHTYHTHIQIHIHKYILLSLFRTYQLSYYGLKICDEDSPSRMTFLAFCIDCFESTLYVPEIEIAIIRTTEEKTQSD